MHKSRFQNHQQTSFVLRFFVILLYLFTMRLLSRIAMRHFSSMCEAANLMIIILCLANLLIFTNQLLDNDTTSLGDAAVDANSIASDLQSGKRGVFAVGYVSNKLTLFVSGTGDHKNPTGGYQVAVDEAADGVFKISSAPVAVPSGIPSDAVKFVCKDSSGDNLVTMSDTEVGALLLPKGTYENTAITGHNVINCYQDGIFHLSSNDAGYFYALTNGNFQKYHFAKDNIKTSTACSVDGDELGQLCISGDSISIKKKCDGSSPSGIISGSVGASNAYLFDDSNTVYAFSASLFKEGGSVKLTKQSKEKAFVVKTKPKPPPPDPKDKKSGHSDAFRYVMASLIFLIIFLVCLSCIAFWLWPCCAPWKEAVLSKFRKGKPSSQRGSSSRGKGGGRGGSRSKSRHSTSTSSKRTRKRKSLAGGHSSGGKSKSSKHSGKQDSKKGMTPQQRLRNQSAATARPLASRSRSRSRSRSLKHSIPSLHSNDSSLTSLEVPSLKWCVATDRLPDAPEPTENPVPPWHPMWYYWERRLEDPVFLLMNEPFWRDLFVDQTKGAGYRLLSSKKKRKHRRIERERRLLADDLWTRRYEPFMSIRSNHGTGHMMSVMVRRRGVGCTELSPFWSIAEAVLLGGRVYYGQALAANDYIWAPFTQQPPPLEEVRRHPERVINPALLKYDGANPAGEPVNMVCDYTPLRVFKVTEDLKEALRRCSALPADYFERGGSTLPPLDATGQLPEPKNGHHAPSNLVARPRGKQVSVLQAKRPVFKGKSKAGKSKSKSKSKAGKSKSKGLSKLGKQQQQHQQQHQQSSRPAAVKSKRPSALVAGKKSKGKSKSKHNKSKRPVSLGKK